MIKHIVTWKLKAGADAEAALRDAVAVKACLEALNGRIPGLLALECGIDLSRTEASADVVLYSEFTDRDALAAYIVHPEHVAAADAIRPLLTDRLVADYEI